MGLFSFLFGSGPKVTSTEAKIPKASEQENALWGLVDNQLGANAISANNLFNAGINAYGSTLNPDYQALNDSAQANLSKIQASLSDLMQGKLPSSYSVAKQAYVQDAGDQFSSVLSNAAKKGVVNSSYTRRASADIGKNLNNTLAKQYSSDVASYASLLNQAQTSALTPLQAASAAQQASYFAPNQMLTTANNLFAPVYDSWSKMYGSRMSLAAPAQNVVTQGNSGLFGTLANAAASYYGAKG